jgi:hypothetical protein
MRDKVLRAFEMYAEGGTIRAARDKLGIGGLAYYQCLRDNPDLKRLYYEIQEARADMMVDEAYAISMDSSLHPQAARVMADIRIKIAAAFDRKRFGEKVAVELDAGPNISEALAAARARTLRPPSDLAQIAAGQVIDITPTTLDATTDKQSAAPSAEPASDEPGSIFD